MQKLKKYMIIFLVTSFMLDIINVGSFISCSVVHAADASAVLADKPVGKKLTNLTVTASDEPEDDKKAVNVLDGNLKTRWAAEGEQWIMVDLGDIKTITSVGLGLYLGTTRSLNMQIEVSENESEWNQLFTGLSSGKKDKEYYNFPEIRAKLVRINCYGNTEDDWNGITELEVYAKDGDGASPSPTPGKQNDKNNTPTPTPTPRKQNDKNNTPTPAPTNQPADTNIIIQSGDKELVILSILGIIDGFQNNKVNKDKVVKRSEFAEILSKMIGMNKTSIYNDRLSVFKDIPTSHSAYNSIRLMKEMGIMSGMDNGKFEPDQPILYEQAVTAMVKILGYDLNAQGKGGYPSGYISVASEKGIIKKVSVPIGNPMTLGALAEMVKETLEADFSEVTTYGSNIKTTVTKGKNLLSEKLNVYKIEGIVTANSNTSIKGDYKVAEDKVEFDNKYVYKVGTSNINSYLGYNVVAYIHSDENDDTQDATVLYAYDDNDTAVTVDAKNIALDRLTSTEFYYWQDKNVDNNSKKLSLSPNMSMIYNGKFSSELVVPMLKLDMGKVTFIDNNEDGIYDVAIVNKYDNYFVKALDDVNYVIYDTYTNNSVTLDETQDEPRVEIYKDGKRIAFNGIHANDVLSVYNAVYSGANSTMIRVEVSSKSISGKIEEITQDAAVIDNVSYNISTGYQNLLNNQSVYTKVPILEMGKQGKFYLDVNGDIAGVDITDGTGYAFLMNIAAKSSLNDNIEMKLFTDKGNVVIYSLASKVTLNGNVVDCSRVMSNPDIYNGRAVVRQVVRYKLNTDGKISELNIAKNISNLSAGDQKRAITDDVFRTTGYTTLYYNSWEVGFGSGNRIKPNFFIDGKTTVFQVPTSEAFYDDEDSYSVGSGFTDGAGYNIQLYDINSYNLAKVVVKYLNITSNVITDEGTSLKVFSSVTNVLNKNGDIVKKVNFYDGGKLLSKLTSPNFSLEAISNLKFGELFQLITNAQDEIVGAATRVTINQVKDDSLYGIFRTEEYGAALRIKKGIVSDRDGEFFTFTVSPTASEVWRYAGNDVFIIDLASQKLRIGSNQDVTNGANVLMRINRSRINAVYIYK